MRRSSIGCPAILAFCALAVACGPADQSEGPAPGAGSPSSGPGAGPAVVVVAPAPFAEIEFEDEDDDHHGDDRVQIEVKVQRAVLAEPGQCGTVAACGHLVLLIDGDACGSPNARSSSPRFEGAFGSCAKVSGPHELVVQLVDDRGNVLARSAPVVVDVRLRGRHDVGDRDGGNDHGHGDDDDDDDDDDHGHHDDDDDDDDHGHHDGGDRDGGGHG